MLHGIEVQLHGIHGSTLRVRLVLRVGHQSAGEPTVCLVARLCHSDSYACCASTSMQYPVLYRTSALRPLSLWPNLQTTKVHARQATRECATGIPAYRYLTCFLSAWLRTTATGEVKAQGVL